MQKSGYLASNLATPPLSTALNNKTNNNTKKLRKTMKRLKKYCKKKLYRSIYAAFQTKKVEKTHENYGKAFLLHFFLEQSFLKMLRVGIFCLSKP
jgi:hypothetical protein